MTADYRIRIADALTDANLDEFALSGVTCSAHINAAGALSATIPIARGDDPTGARIAALKGAAGSAVYVYRNNIPWWPGLLFTKDRSSDERGKPGVAITAGTFEAYWDRVPLETDLPALLATDQMDIARSFLTHLQADPYANMRIVPDATTSPLVTRDRVMYQAAAGPSYLKMLADLANLDGAFEFASQVTVDPTTGARTRRLRLGYPTLATGTVHHVSKPGAILTYRLPEDGSRAATYLRATGSGIISTLHKDTAQLNLGYPRLGLRTSYSAVTDPAVLEAHATADLALARAPVIVPTIRIRLDDAPDITPGSLGDTVKVSIEDEQFPSGFTGTYRLVGMNVNPNERSKSEHADLILN